MLNPALETLQGNKYLLGAFGVVAVLSLLVFDLQAAHDKQDWTAVSVWLLLLGLGFAWVFSVRLSLHPDGISYQSLLGAKEMRWDDVERFYYSARRQSVNFIPVGTYYNFKLVDREGRKLRFGNRVASTGEVGTKLIQFTFKPLLQKMAQRFDAGEEIDLGGITLSRTNGIMVKGLFKNKQLPLDQIAEYRIEKGHLYVFKVGDKRVNGVPINGIPNVFVLVGLLNIIYGRPAA